MRILRTLTLLTFITVIIPGPKLSFPVGLVLILLSTDQSPILSILLTYLSLTAITYTIISLFKNPTQLSHKLNIISLIILYAFLLQFTKDFIKYYGTESLSTLILFLAISLTNLIQTIKKIANPQPIK
jgi:hypothetical protein